MRLSKKGLDAYKKMISPKKGSTEKEEAEIPMSYASSTSSMSGDLKNPISSIGESKPAPINGVRRSAELLMMMSKASADEALSHMSVSEIQRVMQEIVKIKEEQAATKYQAYSSAQSVDGVDIAKGFLKTAFGESESQRILRTAIPDLVEAPFSFLNDVSDDQVVALLKDEPVSILAIILPRIKPVLAKKVLETVPIFDQTDLVKRIVKVKHVDNEVINQVEEVLKERLRLTGGPIEQEEFNGQEALVQILRHMSSDKERDILDKLAQEEPSTAQSIEQQLFTIDAITWIAPKDLQGRLQGKKNEDLALLIKGKTEAIRSLILNSLSKRRAEAVLQEEKLIGLVAKREVDRVTREFLDELREAERNGKLVLMRPGELFL